MDFKKFVKKHKTSLSVLGIGLLVVIVLFLTVGGWFFPDATKSVYGNRLEGIDAVPVKADALEKLASDLRGNEHVKAVDAYVTGRIVNILIDVKNDTPVATAKELSTKVLESFSEAQKKFYDMQLFLTNDSNEKTTYPYIGYKHRTEDKFFWSNNE